MTGQRVHQAVKLVARARGGEPCLEDRIAPDQLDLGRRVDDSGMEFGKPELDLGRVQAIEQAGSDPAAHMRRQCGFRRGLRTPSSSVDEVKSGFRRMRVLSHFAHLPFASRDTGSLHVHWEPSREPFGWLFASRSRIGESIDWCTLGASLAKPGKAAAVGFGDRVAGLSERIALRCFTSNPSIASTA